jgi:hypothetical protein
VITLNEVNWHKSRPAHLVVALVEQWESEVSSAVTKRRHDPDEVLRGLSTRLIGERQKTPRHQDTKM